MADLLTKSERQLCVGRQRAVVSGVGRDQSQRQPIGADAPATGKIGKGLLIALGQMQQCVQMSLLDCLDVVLAQP